MSQSILLACSESLSIDWYKTRAMVPLPFLLQNNDIRVFITFCDENYVGRIGRVDLSKNKLKIKDYSQKPLISIGPRGSFSEKGVVTSSLFYENNILYLFYSGYSRANI